MYRAAEPDISYTEVQKYTDLRYGGIGLQKIRLVQFKKLFSDFIAGYQDSAVYNYPADTVAGFQYSSDYQNLAAAAEVRGVNAAEYYFRYQFCI